MVASLLEKKKLHRRIYWCGRRCCRRRKCMVEELVMGEEGVEKETMLVGN